MKSRTASCRLPAPTALLLFVAVVASVPGCDGATGEVADAPDTVFDASVPDYTDPCAGVEQCAIAGTWCDQSVRLTCAQDAAGCWVITEALDCASLGYGCDPATADCVPDEDYCETRNECEAEGSSCEDDTTLLRCTTDELGCLVLSRRDCAATGTRCLERQAEGDAVCASDPCAGAETCAQEGLSCDGDDIVDCALDPVTGCLVAERTACADTAQTCHDDDTTVACVDPCSLVETCPSDSYCAGEVAVECAPDANGCLVAASMTDCSASSQSCESGASGASCAASLCPQRLASLSCADAGTLSANTSGGTTSFDDHCGQDFLADAPDFPGREGIYAFRNPTRADVRITASGFTDDYDLFAIDGTGRACNPASVGTECLALSATVGSEPETVQFDIEPDETVYVILDRYETTGSSSFSLDIECNDIICGDGLVASSEACDDGDTDPGDGCAADCTVESSYSCAGEPSVCTQGTPGDTCANALPLNNAVETWSSAGLANDYDSYSSCSQTASGADMVFVATLDAGETVDVIVYPDFDAVLALSTDCPSISQTCQDAVDFGFDGGSEQLIYTNSTGSQQTIYLIVDGYWSDAEGFFDIDTIFD